MRSQTTCIRLYPRRAQTTIKKLPTAAQHLSLPFPTRNVLLAQAKGPIAKITVLAKWYLIRQNRPFNKSEVTTIFSWLVMSQLAWIILGTTTFASLLLMGINMTSDSSEFIGKLLRRYFTKDVIIDFKESCSEDGFIVFKDVTLKSTEGLQFDVTAETIKLTLSVKKWCLGQGLLQDVYVSGLRGDVRLPDHKLIEWFDNVNYTLGKVQIRDSSAFINGYKLSVYELHMDSLRFKWMMLDIFNARNCSGSINGSLFSLHKRQHKLAYFHDLDDLSPWKRISRLKIEDIAIKDLVGDATSFNWLTGDMELIADVMVPADDEDNEDPGRYVVMDFKVKFKDPQAKLPQEVPKTPVGNKPIIRMEDMRQIVSYINTYTRKEPIENNSFPQQQVLMAPSDREIISFENDEDDDYVTLRCRIVKNIQDFENVMLLNESNLLDMVVMETYEDLLRNVEEWELIRHNDWMKVLGTTLATQLLLVGMGALA